VTFDIPVGDGPVGGDIHEVINTSRTGTRGEGAVAFQAVTTGFFDDTFTVTNLASDGSLVSQDTYDAPDGCSAPGHAMWLDNSRFVVTCNASDTLVVVGLP
jgi:hypothetical protein